MKKNDLYNLIYRVRKNIKSPYLYANYFLDFNNTEKIYKKFFKEKITLYSYIKIIFLLFRNILFYIVLFIYKSNYFKKDNNNFKIKNIVIIGHRINDLKKNDFYFFKLIKYLKSNNIRYSLFQINHLNKKDKYDVINYYMDLKKEIILFFKLFKSLSRLNEEIGSVLRLKKHKLYFILVIILFHFSNLTAHNLRIPIQINSILSNKMRNINLFITFEGLHWERVLFRKFSANHKIATKKSKVYGLQHSYISLNNKNFFDYSNQLFNPNFILSSGSILQNKIKLNFLDCLNIGSLKMNTNIKYSRLNNPKNIIFLPSSNVIEFEHLLKTLLAIYKKYPDYNYIWRNHPFIGNKIKDIFSNYKNIIVSNNELNDDLKRSKLAFYTISSSIIPAVCFGVRPIYVKNNHFSIDPLENIDNIWKLTSVNLPDINDIYNYEKNHSLLSLMKKTSKYYKKYFESFNPSIIKKIINENL